MKRYLTLFLLLISLSVTAQELDSLKAGEKYQITEADYSNSSVEMADVMRSNGKIYVVVAVIGVMFALIVVYMINIDRKVSRMEKEVFKENVNS